MTVTVSKQRESAEQTACRAWARGCALAQEGRLEEAAACHERALALQPGSIEPINGLANLGNAWTERGDLAEAIDCYQAALRHKPDYAETHYNLANVFAERGDLARAIESYHQALELRPDFAAAHLGLGMLLLLQGRTVDGWREYEWRHQLYHFDPQDDPGIHPRWDGGRLDGGRTLLLLAEGGFGDTIQMLRYTSLVKERAGRVLLECQPALVTLAATSQGVDRVFLRGSARPSYDSYATLLSLPYLFDTSIETIPRWTPYIHADESSIERWRKRLAGDPRLKVGLVWQGSPRNRHADRHRSIPLPRFAPLADVPGTAFFSLQVGPGSEQVRSAPFPLVDLACEFDQGSFADLAAVLVNLDLLITIDSAAAHLAGALGMPVWIALPAPPCWRWLLDRSDSPWYPTARLFRQPRLDDWGPVISDMARALRHIR